MVYHRGVDLTFDMMFAKRGMGRESGHFRTVIDVRPGCQIHEASGFEHESTLGILSEKSVSINPSPQRGIEKRYFKEG